MPVGDPDQRTDVTISASASSGMMVGALALLAAAVDLAQPLTVPVVGLHVLD